MMTTTTMIRVLMLMLTTTQCWLDMSSVQGQLLSSTTKLNTFASLNLSSGLAKYIEHETKRLDVIKNAKGYEKEIPLVKTRLEKLQILVKQAAAHQAEYDSLRGKLKDYHPTSALRLIADFLENWDPKLRNETLYGFRFAEFLSNKDHSNLPSHSDLKHAAQAIAEIQFVYNLSTSDLYSGKVMGHSGTPLRAQDAYEIARISQEMHHLTQAVSWFETALNNTPEAEKQVLKGKNSSYPVSEAIAALGVLKYGMGDKKKGLELLEEATDLDPDNEEIHRQYLIHRYGRDVAPLVHSDVGELRKHWFSLCANATAPRKTTQQWYHACRYRRSTTNPYKVYREEILSRAPFLSLLHRFITPREARQLVNVSASKLKNQPIEGAEADMYLVQGSVLTKKVPVAAVISERISDLTGLDTEDRGTYPSGEPLHVLNYGVSGSFFPHYDVRRPYRPEYLMKRIGHRMASVLIYLSDVKAGGATAFPYLNITVVPETGSALLWYNTSPSGEIERDIINAGCTVAVGEKWVASKGIWSGGNELRRPCGPKVTSSHLFVDKMMTLSPFSNT